MSLTGLIFDIQRFSIHDGPGIRTSVFFKGCSLRCFWCHNPEGLEPRCQIQFFESRCILCGACVDACPEEAQGLSGGIRSFDRSKCRVCGECVDQCYSEALLKVGRIVSVQDVMGEVMADRTFYDASGGGITLTGGEPGLQPEFAVALLQSCKTAGIHTAIETAGNVPWEYLASLQPYIDLWMMDLKLLDSNRHREVIGVKNERIIENAKRIAASGKSLIFRTPVVPSVNDNPRDIIALAAFIGSLRDGRSSRDNGKSPISWELLPFHRMAVDKYCGLGLEYRANNLASPSPEVMGLLTELAQSSGVPVTAQK